MRAGQSGRIAILWNQTEIDGLEAAPLSFLNVGAAWSWRGQARFLVDPVEQGQECAGGAQGYAAKTLGHFTQLPEVADAASCVLILTNGAQQFKATLFSVGGELASMLVFVDGCPARDQEFWISEFIEIERQSGEATRMDGTVVAFPTKPRMDDGLDTLNQRSVASGGRRVD